MYGGTGLDARSGERLCLVLQQGFDVCPAFVAHLPDDLRRPVSRIGCGAVRLRHLDREPAIALLRRAVELGIDHVDTAHFYGNGFVNEVIAAALRPEDDVLVVSEVGAEPASGGPVPLRLAQRPEQLRAGVEENLKSLGLEQIPPGQPGLAAPPHPGHAPHPRHRRP